MGGNALNYMDTIQFGADTSKQSSETYYPQQVLVRGHQKAALFRAAIYRSLKGRSCLSISGYKIDTNPAPNTHEEMKLSPSIGFVIFINYSNRLRMSQLIVMNYQMCESPSPVMGGGLLF